MRTITSPLVGSLSRCNKLARGCIYALAGITVLATPLALAHVDPPGSSATGITISLTAFRNDGVTPVLTSGGTVNECETIMYRCELMGAGGPNAAFEGGVWTITTPDSMVHDVTPVPELPCIGGLNDDPAMPGVPPRGDCAPTDPDIQSALVSYTVTPGDIVAGFIMAQCDLTAAWSHILEDDLPGVGAFIPISLPVTFCEEDGDPCNDIVTCDPDLPFTPPGGGAGLGACDPGEPVVCDNGQFCDGTETCDPGTGECVPGTPPCDPASETCDDTGDICEPIVCALDAECDNGQFCDGAETCDLGTGECVPGTPPCDPASETCDETGDICEPIGCGSDAECDDGVFCNGTESCDVDTGNCVTESACPPFIDGCVIRNAICDEDNNVCIDEIDDSLCEEGEICLPPDGPCVACDSDPRTQGYWYRQCLGVPASEGGIDPGRNGRGPKDVTEPGFVDVLMPCADLQLEGLGFFGTMTCEGMDASPPSDDCERAVKQLTALLLNVCSDRLQFDCPVCIADTCTNTLPEDSDVQGLIDGVAEYIFAGMCKEAAELAALANEGEAICVLDH